MIQLKEVLEGVLEAVLVLPIQFARTHALSLARLPRGPLIAAAMARRSPRRYLGLTTVAFLNTLIHYTVMAKVGVVDEPPAAERVFASVFRLDELSEPEFYELLLLLWALYLLFWALLAIVAAALRRRTDISPLAGAGVYYATTGMLGVLLYGQIVFGLFNAGLTLVNEALTRAFLIAVYSFAFWRLGAALGSRLGLRSRARTIILSAACALVFVAATWLCVGKEWLWPSLSGI
jgi:hypothetical protein